MVPLLIGLHSVWSDLHNYFLPTLKLLKKERVAGKLRETYDREARIALIDRRSGLVIPSP